jgi:CubicO group peptidase (beta-lactamase class C family)
MRIRIAAAHGSVALAMFAAPVLAQPVANRVEFSESLFSGREQYENFNRIDAFYPVAQVAAATQPQPWPRAAARRLPASFRFNQRKVDSQTFLKETDTAALLVIKDGKIRFEQYWLTGGPQVRWMSMSVAKSFTSTLLGLVIADGKIGSVEEPITKYLPEMAGTAYEGVRIKDALQMSSGAFWREDYSDRASSIFVLAEAMATGSPFAAAPQSITRREHPPGTFNRYNSAETMVLGMLIERATGQRLADYMQAKLWQPLGAESNAYWIVDNTGAAMAFGGLNATARDYARLGELFRLGGKWQGKQVLPAQWIRDSITPDAPHLMPGKRSSSDSDMGYGYQWWIPGGGQGDYSAIGVYNQFVYVNPKARMVIVKLSANSGYGQTNDDTSWREWETITLFRAIAKTF